MNHKYIEMNQRNLGSEAQSLRNKSLLVRNESQEHRNKLQVHRSESLTCRNDLQIQTLK